MKVASDIPKVSILIANFNNSKYVLDTLNSIENQTYQNLELVIVDDYSSDDSPEKIEQWVRTTSRPVQFIRHAVNKGICATCNELVANASGKYISFIATDDMYLPDKITSQVKTLEQLDSSYGLLYGDAYLMDEKGSRRPGTFIKTLCNVAYPPSGSIIDELQNINFLHWITVLIK